MRSGSLSARLETSAATPAVAPGDVVFGLGRRAGVDAVRVLWPSGTLQAEAASQPSTLPSPLVPLIIEELDRKPSSCPFLYTWNGERFEFVTDFMGAGEMGYSVGPGVYNRPDPIEYVRIRADQLQAKDGRFDLRVTNELEEALFVDRLQLVAIAHPVDMEVFPNEGMTDPPKPFRLHGVRDARVPLRAVDDRGHDVTARIAHVDRRYPDAPEPQTFAATDFEMSPSMEHIRYAAAACQTDMPNPVDRRGMRANTDRMLSMIDAAVAGSAPFLPVRLVVFPEFAHAAPVFPTVAELLRNLTVSIPNEDTERLTSKAREHDIDIQSGSMLEEDPRWPGVVFNTTCLIGPAGILSKYRKVNPWIPYEVHSSPHDIPGYDEPLFPVVETPIGRIGCAICYDWLFPEVLRLLAANGAEVLVRVSAYMDPWGATEPMNWWTVINRARAIENVAYVVAANQGASLRHYPPYSWPGGSQVVDFDGRLLAEASPGPGERIVVVPIDVSALRHERRTRVGHHMPAHLRTEAYAVYQTPAYPPRAAPGAPLTYEENVRRIEAAKERTLR